MKSISIHKALDLIRGAGGKFFTVEFVKRTTGERRNMNCRLGVQKGVTGKGMAYDPIERGLLPVHTGKGFRMINLDTVLKVTVGGKIYRVKGTME